MTKICACQQCEIARFQGFIDAICKLDKDDLEETGPQTMELIQAIHDDIAWRYPLGIARELSWVIDYLAVGNVDDAVDALEEMIHTERKSAELNNCELDEGCIKKKGPQRYTLIQNDGRWYICPADRIERARAWLDSVRENWGMAPDKPKWLMEIEIPGGLSFTDPREE